jgi:hypothetical protein
MASRGWGIRTGYTVIGILAAVLAISPSAMANPVGNPLWGLYYLVPINLPINTFLLLLMYALFASSSGVRTRFGARRFFELFVYSTLIITVSGALIDGIAFATENLFMLPICAFFIGLVVYWVCNSVLDMSARWSLIAAINFFVINLLVWVLMIGVFESDVLSLGSVLFLLYFIMLPVIWMLAKDYHSLDRYAEVTTVDSAAMGYSYRFDPRMEAEIMTDGKVIVCRLLTFALVVILFIVSLPF